jgi:hypothetical protein
MTTKTATVSVNSVKLGTIEINVPASVTELQEHFSDSDIIEGFYKSRIIELQAKHRRGDTFNALQSALKLVTDGHIDIVDAQQLAQDEPALKKLYYEKYPLDSDVQVWKYDF